MRICFCNPLCGRRRRCWCFVVVVRRKRVGAEEANIEAFHGVDLEMLLPNDRSVGAPCTAVSAPEAAVSRIDTRLSPAHTRYLFARIPGASGGKTYSRLHRRRAREVGENEKTESFQKMTRGWAHLPDRHL